MCGIVGVVGHDTPLDVLVGGLSRLDYRGYDSAGVAVADDRIAVCKREGKVDRLREAIRPGRFDGTVGVGHTRWSTHGEPSDRNAHPHTDPDDRVAVVHNGIVQNYESLRAELREAGVEFSSETDTEVIPNLIARALDRGAGPAEAVRIAADQLAGSYAFAAVVAGDDRLFAARQDMPLIVGVGEEATYLGSDEPAFLDHTDRVVYVEDDEFLIADASEWRVVDTDGRRVDKTVEAVEWDPEDVGKGGYDHYMAKEIHEQPQALRQCLTGRADELAGSVELPDVASLPEPDAVQLVAAGTSYHAAVYTAEALRAAGVPATARLASEYAETPPPVGPETLVVGVTQSGETADTLAALRAARDRGARTLAVTNKPRSTAGRECEFTLHIRAGPEICVAATKTFSSQLAAANLLVERLADRSSEETRAVVAALRDLPDQLQRVLDETSVEHVVDAYIDAAGYFFVGRGLAYPVALEGALKFKEITYEHAEGFAAGELKHGTLALVTEDRPVFAVVTGDDETARKTVANVKEIQSRDAPVVAVTDGRTEVERYADHVLEIPAAHPRTAPLLANVQLQLVAYHTADALGRPIDKPRHLAKSVTVE